MTAMKSIHMAFALLWIHVLLSYASPQQALKSASVEGITIELGTRSPLARVKVTLARVEEGGGTATVTTDSDGKFLFQNLPAGRYKIDTNRDGYVPSAVDSHSPDGLPASFVLNSNQEMKDVVIVLAPTGAISGRIRNQSGDPVGNMTVQALSFVYVDGRRILTPFQTVKTNDRGEYRLYWLQPGQYLVRTVPPENPNRRDIAPSGPNPIAENAVSFRGRPASDEETFVSVYSPGTTDSNAATPIDLRPGIELDGVDLTVGTKRAVRVRGKVIGGVSGGTQTRSVLTLVARSASIGEEAQRTQAQPDGTFEFRGVVPDSYELIATMSEPGRSPTGSRSLSTSGPSLAGRISLEVGSADIENVVLKLLPGISIEGRITVEGTPAKPTPGLTNLHVQLRTEPSIPPFAPQIATVTPNGSFTVKDAFSGDYRLAITGMPRNSYIKAARLGGSDVLNAGIQISGAPHGPLEITIGFSSTVLDAVVVDNGNIPTAGATVVLVPEPMLRQRSDLYGIASTDSSGRVHLEGFMPGTYKAFAWNDVPKGAWQDPDFLRAFESRGIPLRIDEGTSAMVTLRLMSSRL
jgi:hypothetical protein